MISVATRLKIDWLPQSTVCFRLYVKKCLGCSERVAPEELVMRACESIFHLRCFVCVVCGIRLQKGDLYVIKQGQLFCRIDYEKEVEMLQGYGHGKALGLGLMSPRFTAKLRHLLPSGRVSNVYPTFVYWVSFYLEETVVSIYKYQKFLDIFLTSVI